MRWISAVAGLAAIAATAACDSGSSSGGGCQSDLDCKGDRICLGHMCIDPMSPSGGNPDSAVSTTVPQPDATGVPRTTLGASCSNDCEGTWCASGGSAVSRVCEDSDLTLPCLGTSAGMYCSRSCTSDAECANPNIGMVCLTECARSREAAGRCWTTSSASFLRASVCGTSTGTGGAVVIRGSGGVSGAGGMGGAGGAVGSGPIDAGGREVGVSIELPPPPPLLGGITGRGGSGGGGAGGTTVPATWAGTPASCPATAAPAIVFTEGFEGYSGDLYGASGSPWIAVEPNGLVEIESMYTHSGQSSVRLWDFGDAGTHYAPLALPNRPALLSVELWYYADSFFPEHTYASVGVGFASSKFSLVKHAQVRGVERSLLFSANGGGEATSVFDELELGRYNYLRLDFDFCQAKVLIYVGSDAAAPLRGVQDFDVDSPINALFIAGGGNFTYLDDFKVSVSPAPADVPTPDRG